MRTWVFAISFILFVATAQAGDKSPAVADVRKAVERSLPFLEKEGLAWKDERNCLSCHHVPFMLWSHNEAQARGIAVDAKKLASWNDWSMKQSLSARGFFKLSAKAIETQPLKDKLKDMADKGFTHESDFRAALAKALTPDELKQQGDALVKLAVVPKKGGQNDGGGLDTMGQLLLGWNYRDAATATFLPGTAELLVRWQEPTGVWKAAGQLPARKWPTPVADQTTTMWSLLALANLDKPDAKISKAIEQGLTSIKKAKPEANHEWQVVRLLVEQKFGTPEQTAILQQQLIDRQHADGGWSWQAKGKSDALSTGLGLYALRITGVAPDAAVVTRGQRFLLATQGEDGSWLVSPSDISSTTAAARLKRLEPIYHYWGSAWASIGLARSLP